MADARALLRAERASRRITHPHASYSSDGKLLCNLCETLVKSEAQWQSHLHSTQHNLRSQRQHSVVASRGVSGVGGGGAKKRKADVADSIERSPQERKKARAESKGDAEGLGEEVEAVVADESVDEALAIPPEANGTAQPAPKISINADINPDDILAFERELATLEADAAKEDQASLRTAATISAAPLTAEQLAAQAREEQSAQRGKRDVELEDEREDAARVLEEEMEEMEGLEERVRRLRERREGLRGSGDGGGVGVPAAAQVEEGVVDGGGEADGKGESSDEDDDEDFDEWKFGGS